MVQIVSGLNPNQRMEAYLAGGNQQLKIHALQQQAAQEQERTRAIAQDHIAKVALAKKAEEAKALAAANARAAMGDVQAMRQQDMEAAANGLPPDQKRLMEYAKLRSDPRIAGNEDALRELDEGFVGQEKRIKEHKQQEAISGIIDTAVKDGLTTPEDVQARQAAGEEPEQIAKELAGARQKRRQETMAMEKNGKAIQQARALLDTMPSEDNPDYDQALEVITELEQSASAQANPNSGKAMLDLVRRLASKEEMRKFKKNLEREPNFLGMGGPEMPQSTPGTHATLRGLASGAIKGGGKQKKTTLDKDLPNIARRIKSPQQGALQLEALGYDLSDPEVQQAIRSAYAPQAAGE